MAHIILINPLNVPPDDYMGNKEILPPSHLYNP